MYSVMFKFLFLFKFDLCYNIKNSVKIERRENGKAVFTADKR